MPKINKPKNGHQMTVPSSLWEWGIANDPLGRTNPAPYLRDVLGRAAMASGTLGQPLIEVLETEPEPPPKPKPFLAIRHKRTRSHRGGPCWSMNETTKADYDNNMRGNRLALILCEYDNREVIRVWYDPANLEQVFEPDGTPYYLLDVTAEGVRRAS